MKLDKSVPRTIDDLAVEIRKLGGPPKEAYVIVCDACGGMGLNEMNHKPGCRYRKGEVGKDGH